jgi:hypothetical protein
VRLSSPAPPLSLFVTAPSPTLLTVVATAWSVSSPAPPSSVVVVVALRTPLERIVAVTMSSPPSPQISFLAVARKSERLLRRASMTSPPLPPLIEFTGKSPPPVATAETKSAPAPP